MRVTTNNKHLVRAGHEFAAAMNDDTPIITIAKMVTELASALDVQSARSDGLAAENAYLMPKAASELSNAWVLHKYLIGIQAAIMYLDNGNKKAAQEWLYGTIAGPGFDFPDEIEDIDAWAIKQLRGSISHSQALEIIKAETPATDAWVNEQRALGVEMFALKYAEEAIKSNNITTGWRDKASRAASEYAEQLRGGKS